LPKGSRYVSSRAEPIGSTSRRHPSINRSVEIAISTSPFHHISLSGQSGMKAVLDYTPAYYNSAADWLLAFEGLACDKGGEPRKFYEYLIIVEFFTINYCTPMFSHLSFYTILDSSNFNSLSLTRYLQYKIA
jgi:hypothetical protein